uniref:Putative secreted protein n=1 Tax=Rhipicephalus microplus TaxID=6941 RepID=A0A6G5A1A3_RHIMP
MSSLFCTLFFTDVATFTSCLKECNKIHHMIVASAASNYCMKCNILILYLSPWGCALTMYIDGNNDAKNNLLYGKRKLYLFVYIKQIQTYV